MSKELEVLKDIREHSGKEIVKCANGKQKYAKGYFWKYIKEN